MLHMRELHGIVRFGCPEEQLKRQAIMFDRFHVVHNHFGFGPPSGAQNAAEWDALETLGIAERVPERFGDEVTIAELLAFSGYRSDASALDSYIRYAASKYTDSEWDVVPICQFPLPSGPDPAPEMLASLQRARPGFGTAQTAKKKSIESVSAAHVRFDSADARLLVRPRSQRGADRLSRLSNRHGGARTPAEP